METIRDTYLGRLAGEFHTMTSLVMEQGSQIATLLEGTAPSESLEAICAREREIDKTEVSLRNGIINAMALQTPRAGDLRRLIAYYDAIIDLERIADELYGIAKKLVHIRRPGSVYYFYREQVLVLFGMAREMLSNAILSFTACDDKAAMDIIQSDTLLDAAYHACYRDLVTRSRDNHQDSWMVSDMLELERILYNIERIGDGATNICESVVFLAKGMDIKHSGGIS